MPTCAAPGGRWLGWTSITSEPLSLWQLQPWPTVFFFTALPLTALALPLPSQLFADLLALPGLTGSSSPVTDLLLLLCNYRQEASGPRASFHREKINKITRGWEWPMVSKGLGMFRREFSSLGDRAGVTVAG